MNNYLNELSRLLANSISPEEFNNVMQYYTEYFADAGIEKQEEVIKELGTPKELANKIIAEYNSRQNNEKHSEIPSESSTDIPAESSPKPRRKLAKKWIVLIVIGGVLIFLSMFASVILEIIGFMFFPVADIAQEYMVMEEFDSIIVDANIASVEIVKGEEYAVEYVLGEDSSLVVEDAVLTIEDKSFNNVFMSDLSNYEDTYIKIYVPEDEVVDIDISVAVGNVNITDIKFNSVNIEADTGDVSVEGNSEDGDVYIAADVGKVSVKGFLACDMEVKADIGKVDITSYYSSDSYNCNLESDLGKETIREEGGMELDGEYEINVAADLGSIKVVFCDN